MLQKFLELEDIIYHTLRDLKLRSLFLDETEIDSLKALVEALKQVEIGSRKLCRRKVTLGKADKIFELMLEKLYKLTTPIGRELFTSVESRIKERRNKNTATLQAFLEDHEFFNQLEEGNVKFLDYAPRKEVFQTACFLYKRLFPSEASEVEEVVDENVDEAKVMFRKTEYKLASTCIMQHEEILILLQKFEYHW